MMLSARCTPPRAFRSGAAARPFAPISRWHSRTALQFCAVNSDKDADVQSSKESFSDEEIRKLAELRRQSQAKAQSPNIVQGALEEASLITWPSPQKAVLDTVLVLAIVAGTSFLLLGVNIGLNNISDWWYHTRA